MCPPPERNVVFASASGPLSVTRSDTGYVLNFPTRSSTPVTVPNALVAALGATPVEALHDSANNYVAVFAGAQTVRALDPDFAAIGRLDRIGVIVTAPGDGPYDLVSRYFAPAKGVPEDPVTGGAHCMLTPYWARRLGKTTLRAYQALARGGELLCRLVGDRVELEGACVFYLEGEVEI